jgi:hypothetical protein
MFAFPMFLVREGVHTGRTVWLVLAWIFAAPGLVLSYYTAVAYIPQIRTNLRIGREERALARQEGAAR